MQVKMDWLSFTAPVYAVSSDLDVFASNVMGGLLQLVGPDTFKAALDTEWKERKGGRAPYSYSHDLGQSGIVVFSNPRIGNVLVELSGKACDSVRSMGVFQELLARVQNRITRCDLACDIECSTLPSEFAPKEHYGTSKTYSSLNSQSGETVYLGSTASERYTRVYRYKVPHPRSHLLRVEFVFRRKVARAFVAELLVQGEQAVAAWAGNKEHFRHPIWKPTDEPDRFTAYARAEREAGKTVFWLITSVAPAFKRLVDEGVIEHPEEFLNSYFLRAT